MAGACPPAFDTIGKDNKQTHLVMFRISWQLLLLLTFSVPALAQEYRISKPAPEGSSIEITNLSGKVSVDVQPDGDPSGSKGMVSIVATSQKGVTENEIK